MFEELYQKICDLADILDSDYDDPNTLIPMLRNLQNRFAAENVIVYLTEAIAVLETDPRQNIVEWMVKDLRIIRADLARLYDLPEVLYLDPRKNVDDTDYTEDVPMLYKNGRPYGSRITGFSRDNWHNGLRAEITNGALLKHFGATDILYTSERDFVVVVDGKLTSEMDTDDVISAFIDQQITARGLEVRDTPMRICNVNNQYVYVFPQVSDADAAAYLERRKQHG